MPFDVPLSSHARAVDIAARALASGETPQAVQHRLWEIGTAPTPEAARPFVAEAEESIRFNTAVNAGDFAAANRVYENAIPLIGGFEAVIQAVATIRGPQGAAERPIRLTIPTGATLEEVLALVSATAASVAEMGAGNDTPGGGNVTDIRFIGLYQQ